MPVIGIVAGEDSGDLLGAELIHALKKGSPELRFTGIGGKQMSAAGFECLYPSEKLAVMGIVEVIRHYPELRRIRANVKKHFISQPPALFIGIDAPDFNIALEHDLRAAGIHTVHYVSPSIWAWREYRLKKIAQAVDMMLTLFPFESSYYEKMGIPVQCVGHPLARRIPLKPDPAAARARLNLPQDAKIIALMPGSRASEWEKLAEPFLQTALWCKQSRPELRFITNLTSETACEYFAAVSRRIAPKLEISVFTGQSLDVMGAADVVLLASGTAALEAMLLKRPMVVAYRVNWLTYQIVRRLIRVPYVSLPNLLAGEALVPECLQYDCEPTIMGREILAWLDDRVRTAKVMQKFLDIHESICPDADELLANTLLDMIHA